MAVPIKAIDTLLRVKRRRVEQAQEALKAAGQALKQREKERDDAQAHAQSCRDAENQCAEKIAGMCSGGFLASHLLALRHVHEGLKATTQSADKAVAAAGQQVQAAQQALSQARRTLQKAESVVDFLKKRREDLLREIENAREELQDEESEEAAVARMLAAAAKEAEQAGSQGH